MSGATGVDVSLPVGFVVGGSSSSPTSASTTTPTAAGKSGGGGNDVEAALRKLPPDQGAVLLDDLSLTTQVKLLGALPPSKVRAEEIYKNETKEYTMKPCCFSSVFFVFELLMLCLSPS